MTPKTILSPLWLSIAVSILALPVVPLFAQSAPATSPAQSPAPAFAPAPTASPILIAPVKPAATPVPDRSQAYFHSAMATIYAEEAATQGRPDYITQAIEEYKKALNFDPTSPLLNSGLADLYFRTGRTHEAEVTTRELLKNAPNDVNAHKLLGHIYLRQLSEGQAANSGNVLDQAIAEFEKIIALQPKSVEDRMVLGQLYTVKHDAKKAEDQFKSAQAVEPDSEEVVLNLARLYAESGDLAHAIKVVEAVPEADRSPKMELALGASYEQLKQPKEAIAAYRRAAVLDRGDAHVLGALAQALLADNQLDEALVQFKALAEADPEDAGAFLHMGEILRRQGKYEEALAAIRKATKKDPGSLEAGYNEGLLLDVLGRYDEAAVVFEKMVDQTSHANGAYTAEEKNNRGIFLERLGAVYREQNKVDQAIAAYQKIIDMGGESAIGGYRGQIAVYSEAKNFDRAAEVARKAVEANPKDNDLKLILADVLVDQGKTDDALAVAHNLVEKSGDDRAAWIGLAQLSIRLRRWKDADEALAKASALTVKQEDRITLLFLKGESAERQKHFEPAEQFFRQILDLDPAHAATLNYLGYMLADKGTRLSEALKMIRKAVELDPMDGAYLDSLGWAYFKLGQYELAEENLLHAVERDRSDPTVHDHLGDLYEKTGRIRLAAAQWEISLAEYGKSPSIDAEPGDVAKVQHKLESARTKLAKQENAAGQKPE
jgi:tetratricopeptide (TPR) repeat protein